MVVVGGVGRCGDFEAFGDLGVSIVTSSVPVGGVRRVVSESGSRLSDRRVTLVTLVSQKQPLWRGVTQGGGGPRLSVQGEPLVVLTRGP